MPNTQFNTLLDILSSLSSQNTNFQSFLSTIGCSSAVSLVFSCPLHLLSPGSFSLLFPLHPCSSRFFSSILLLYFLLMCPLFMVSRLSIYLPFPNFCLQPRSILNSIYSTIHVQNTVCYIPSEISSFSADGKSILLAAYIETLE